MSRLPRQSAGRWGTSRTAPVHDGSGQNADVNRSPGQLSTSDSAKTRDEVARQGRSGSGRTYERRRQTVDEADEVAPEAVEAASWVTVVARGSSKPTTATTLTG